MCTISIKQKGRFFMSLIQQILTDFYDCTSISIQYVDEQLNRLNSAGKSFTGVDVDITVELRKLIQQNRIQSFTTGENIRYIILPFKENPHPSGYFVVGPYQGECLDSEIPFKPSHCTPYFEALLTLIIKRKLLNNKEQNEHIVKGLQYIDENYQQPITLGQISEYLNLNTCYFCVLFKTETGLTFNQYLNKIRIDNSKELLVHSKKSIIDIALIVGFKHHSHYSQTFKKLISVTPVEYRNQC